jgi:hypothetical protein
VYDWLIYTLCFVLPSMTAPIESVWIWGQSEHDQPTPWLLHGEFVAGQEGDTLCRKLQITTDHTWFIWVTTRDSSGRVSPAETTWVGGPTPTKSTTWGSLKKQYRED